MRRAHCDGRLRRHRAQPKTRPGSRKSAPNLNESDAPKQVKKAGLDQPGKPPLRFHDLRHTYASLLIAQGVNVAFVSRQLGHASITTTLNVYTHLFDHAEHAASVIERLEDRFGEVLAGMVRSPEGRPGSHDLRMDLSPPPPSSTGHSAWRVVCECEQCLLRQHRHRFIVPADEHLRVGADMQDYACAGSLRRLIVDDLDPSTRSVRPFFMTPHLFDPLQVGLARLEKHRHGRRDT